MSQSGGVADLEGDVQGLAASHIGEVLQERYQLEEVIGSGGVGVVYRAKDLEGGEDVALKLLHEQFGLTGVSRSRFAREGNALQRLAHPNIVELRAVGVDDGVPFLVMELLRGSTLSQVLRDGAMEPRQAVSVATQMLSALEFAHGLGVIHRDLKPGNIVVDDSAGEPVVKMLDFGLAKFLSDESTGASQTLTQSGMVLGTPQYMPPEQGTGDRVDARADIYALGCVLYEMLAGRPAFERESQVELVRAHLLDPPPPLPRRASLTNYREELDVVVARAMAKEPEERYASAQEMRTALESLGTGALTAGRRSARRGIIGLMVAMALWLALGLWWARGELGVAPSGDAPAADPWKALGIPPELSKIHQRAIAGKRLNKDEQGDLRAFIRLHPEDPRALLLEGHAFANQDWYRDAIERYGRAAALDPGALSDPKVLSNLVQIAATSKQHGRTGSAFIVKHYGKRARPAVEAALADAPKGSPRATRLKRLLTLLD